jgi:PhzF family phenazine biosynthesis protein
MELPIYKVDAFTDRLFAGNPAAVCPLTRWLGDATMQSIAAENNLAETAFFVPEGDGFALRWFTPKVEVDLCGHATLASAFVISRFLDPGREEMRFETRSGCLIVTREEDAFRLDFPTQTPKPVDNPSVGKALGRKPSELLASTYYLAVHDDEEEVAALKPDMAALSALDRDGVIAAAPGRNGIDYVFRFFAPAAGIPEDPATGSAQCLLIPYWAARLKRERLVGRQISERGGDFRGKLRGDRVMIVGRGVCYLRGSIFVDG